MYYYQTHLLSQDMYIYQAQYKKTIQKIYLEVYTLKDKINEKRVDLGRNFRMDCLRPLSTVQVFCRQVVQVPHSFVSRNATRSCKRFSIQHGWVEEFLHCSVGDILKFYCNRSQRCETKSN